MDRFAPYYTKASTLNELKKWEDDYINKIDKKVKSIETAAELRSVGNDHYLNKEYLLCYYFYTKSLLYAPPNDESYSLALSNRSALFYEQKQYNACLEDIERCLKSSYPRNIYPKITLRQCHCYHELGLNELLDKTLDSCIKECENSPDLNSLYKDKFKNKFQQLLKATRRNPSESTPNDSEDSAPALKHGENEKFLSASSALNLKYDRIRGRHVVANRKIKRGDVLFIEKAYFTAPIFTQIHEIVLVKCYYCLNDVKSPIPCLTCTMCVYCDEKCRELSWEDSHKWECEGMKTEVWYDLGLFFAAFKAVCKGIPSGFRELEVSKKDKKGVLQFGTKDGDNYPYFNSMESHLEKLEVDTLLEGAARVVYYLERHTSFFSWLLEQPQCPKKNFTELRSFIGGMLLKHCAQTSCNASWIQHWVYAANEDCSWLNVASGLFPSISMMNHACKPNVSVYYVGDTAVVSAVEDISKNEQVFNCYGIDYRTMDRASRQKNLKDRYCFSCTCCVCTSDKVLEYLYDTFDCPNCKNAFVYSSQKMFDKLNCESCGCNLKSHLESLAVVEDDADTIDRMPDEKLKLQDKALEYKLKLCSFYNQKHTITLQIRSLLFKCYLLKGDLNKAVINFKEMIKIVSEVQGSSSRRVGIKLSEGLTKLTNMLCQIEVQDVHQYKEVIQFLKASMEETTAILKLHFPDAPKMTKDLRFKIEFLCKMVDI